MESLVEQLTSAYGAQHQFTIAARAAQERAPSAQTDAAVQSLFETMPKDERGTIFQEAKLQSAPMDWIERRIARKPS